MNRNNHNVMGIRDQDDKGVKARLPEIIPCGAAQRSSATEKNLQSLKSHPHQRACCRGPSIEECQRAELLEIIEHELSRNEKCSSIQNSNTTDISPRLTELIENKGESGPRAGTAKEVNQVLGGMFTSASSTEELTSVCHVVILCQTHLAQASGHGNPSNPSSRVYVLTTPVHAGQAIR
jgi:hypothetical protein